VCDPPTFVCQDCGADVYDALGAARERCYPCQWVADIVDEAERAEVRDWLIEVGVIEERIEH
jgi:hypothetical protein